MKKLLVVMSLATAIALALLGCGGGASSAASSAADTSAAETSAAEASAAETSEETGAQTGMANPWSDVASAEEAAAGAGFDSFSTPVGLETSLGVIEEEWATYRCMEGIAEVHAPVAAVELFVRKGVASAAESGDISGDYNTYANTWTENINGMEVTCFGNREGEATKSIWSAGDMCYCVLAYGAGGDTDFGLRSDDLNLIVSATQ